MKTPKWLEDAIFYEIYPPSFYDSNDDGIGDIPGITAKLDYILSLGCNAIWLNPCFDSPFKDGGYDVRDYKKIAPRYGSNEDLFTLVKEMHKRGMHLLLDLVICHTSDEHEWFKISSQDKTNRYADRYIWTNHCFEKTNEGISCVGGAAPRNGCYAISFFNSQPSLNYGFLNKNRDWQKDIFSKESIDTQDDMIDVVRYWLSHGVDGFRVDMAACLVKNDDSEERGTQEVWKRMFSIIKEEYKESAFVAEWASPHRSLNCGFDMDFYLDHGWDQGNGYHHLLRKQNINYDTYKFDRDDSYFKTESHTNPKRFIDEYMFYYYNTKDNGYISFMTDNHDMVRTSYFYNEHELKIIYSFLLTMPGVPYIYYGDEIGMKYLPIPTKEGGYFRTGSRTPMQWSESINKGFSKADKTKLYLPIDEDGPSVEKEENREDSLLKTFKTLINLRKKYDSLKSINNIVFDYYSEDNKLMIYHRDDFYFIVNPSLEEFSFDFQGDYELIYKVGDYDVNNRKINKSSFVILRKK